MIGQSGLVSVTLTHFFLGLQEAPGRERPTYSERLEDQHPVPPAPRDPPMPHALPDSPSGVRQELGQGREDRRRVRGVLLQGHRLGHLFRLHQQLLDSHGLGQDGGQAEVGACGLPKGGSSPSFCLASGLITRLLAGEADQLA